MRKLGFFLIAALILSGCGAREEPTATPSRTPRGLAEATYTGLATDTPQQANSIEVTKIATAALSFATNTPIPTAILADLKTNTPIPTATNTRPPETPTITPTPTFAALGPYGFPVNVNPLTGLIVADPAALNRRPLAVKVSNSPSSTRWRQRGLSQADLVFEHYTEGGTTRLTAVFYTHTPEKAGPVRSARLIDIEIPQMYQALFAFSGAVSPLRNILYGYGFEKTPGVNFYERIFEEVANGTLYTRADDDMNALYALPAKIWEAATQKGQNDRPNPFGGMSFMEEIPLGGIPATTVTIPYRTEKVEWHYNSETGLWERWVDNTRHTEILNPATEESVQLMAANVVIIFANHAEDRRIVEDEYGGGHFSTQIQIWGVGPVHIFRDGRMYEGYWNRHASGDMLSFNDIHGNTLYLKPGNTWFQVVPQMRNFPDYDYE